MIKSFPLFNITLFLVLVLVSVCSLPAEQQKPVKQATTEADIAAILDIWSKYATAINNADIDSWISLWIDDGVQMPPDRPAIKGKEQIKANVQSTLDQFIFKMEIFNEEVKVADDWAFARGTYTYSLTPKEGAEPYENTGKYLTILERQADGSWKIARDCFNNNEKK